MKALGGQFGIKRKLEKLLPEVRGERDGHVTDEASDEMLRRVRRWQRRTHWLVLNEKNVSFLCVWRFQGNGIAESRWNTKRVGLADEKWGGFWKWGELMQHRHHKRRKEQWLQNQGFCFLPKQTTCLLNVLYQILVCQAKRQKITIFFLWLVVIRTKQKVRLSIFFLNFILSPSKKKMKLGVLFVSQDYTLSNNNLYY